MRKTFNVHTFLTAYEPSGALFYLKYAPIILIGLNATSSLAPPSGSRKTYCSIL